MNVGQTLLNNAEQSGFNLCGQTEKITRNFDFYVDTRSFFEALRVPVHRGRKPQFIEQRWMQQIRKECEFLPQPGWSTAGIPPEHSSWRHRW